MKKTILSALVLASCTASLSAEEYTTFFNLGHAQVDVDGKNDHYSYLAFEHNFEAQETLGPLNQFDFINTTSYIYGSIFDANETSYSLGGNYYAGPVIVGGSYAKSGDFNVKSFNLGYLINSDFMVLVEANDPSAGDTTYRLSTAYTHRLENTDYLGFRYSTNEEFDYHALYSTYFAAVGSNQFIKAGLSLSEFDGDTYWNADAQFYFNKYASIGASFDEDSNKSLNAQFYFNKNFALRAFAAEEGDADTIGINLIAQF